MPCSGGLGGAAFTTRASPRPTLQSGSNSTSYSFQTVAAFNGVNRGEVGSKSTTGSGQTNDHVNSGGFQRMLISAPNSTSYGYGEQAFLDDNGAWQYCPRRGWG